MKSEAAAHADFSYIRYAQVWEDADVLLEALDIHPEDVCFSIASAGDNALAMLSRGPRRVVAVDLNPAQLACLELRVAAYRELEYPELLVLMGSRYPAAHELLAGEESGAAQRRRLYRTCRGSLTPATRAFWDERLHLIDEGIGAAGKFERYFGLFRNVALPLVHTRRTIATLLQGGDRQHRLEFHDGTWNTLRWRLLFRLFFSRFVMGRMGRDPSFFRYVEGTVPDRILARTRHALVELNPAENPYLHWILTGTHGTALPFALREENFQAIRAHLDRLEYSQASVESYLAEHPEDRFSKWNLSDIFEYMSDSTCHALLQRIVDASTPGARLAYWNMLAPRCRPESMRGSLAPLRAVADLLHMQDKAFFYSAFILEEVCRE